MTLQETISLVADCRNYVRGGGGLPPETVDGILATLSHLNVIRLGLVLQLAGFAAYPETRRGLLRMARYGLS